MSQLEMGGDLAEQQQNLQMVHNNGGTQEAVEVAILSVKTFRHTTQRLLI
jgi:hypothetical protein